MDKDKRIAVLIDADNAPRKSIKSIMDEIAVYGNPTIKRIYGDWTNPNMNSWKTLLLDNAITPIQQYGYTTGKNSTDSAMIIDAMDILYAGQVEAFCLVSSDSDFTRLALRLREAGMTVLGIGEKKTPSPFIKACDKFIYIEIVNERNKKKIPDKPKSKEKPNGKAADTTAVPDTAAAEAAPSAAEAAEPEHRNAKTEDKPVGGLPQEIIDFISSTIDDVGDDDGWAYLGEVGGLLQKKQPDFDPRNYGFKKLTLLIDSCDCFAMDIRENVQKGNGKLIYISNRK